MREVHLSFVAKKRSFGGDDAWGKKRRRRKKEKEEVESKEIMCEIMDILLWVTAFYIRG